MSQLSPKEPYLLMMGECRHDHKIRSEVDLYRARDKSWYCRECKREKERKYRRRKHEG